VQVEHRAVVNFLTSMHREPGFAAGDRLLAVTTVSFDIAALEIFGPLTSGGTVILASRATALDARELADLLVRSGATLMQATPATWRMLIESGWRGHPRLRILCGGEALPRTLANQLLMTGAAVWNLYGPTETTIWSTVSRVTPGDAHPDIGHPIANTQIHILDAGGRLVPPGVPGELCIGGDGVARGYLNRPELTAERFVHDAFADEPGRRLYRTGDLARRRADGVIQCLGRVDHQVKIRGYRIEPGEIEAILARHAGIAQVVVVASGDASGVQRLVAYFVPRGEAPAPAELRQALAVSLPDYMIPSVFMSLPALPLTPNGKIDRRSLPAPEIAIREQVPVRTDTERKLAAIWSESLGVSSIGAHDNFFDLGGHSLLAARVLSRVHETFDLRLPMKSIFEAPTVAELAGRIEARAVPRPAVASRVEIEL
jgi:acyl-CoA synthetase (AMP-forming)/AMP-acid ligase II/acyl carrier protein